MNTDLYALGLTELWPLVLGVLLPLAIALVTRATWRPWAKSLVMVAFVLVTTIIGEWIAGNLMRPGGLRELVRSIFVVFLLTVTSYRHVWRPTGVAPAIEDATSPAPRHALDETSE